MGKKHPYRKLAVGLRKRAEESRSAPRVIGLTASYTYEVREEAARNALQRLCDEVMFTKLEMASEEELEASGYHAKACMAEVLAEDAGCSTVPTVALSREHSATHHRRLGYRRENVNRTECPSAFLNACITVQRRRLLGE